MTEIHADLPPVIQLILSEKFTPENRDRDLKKLKGLLSDLKDQADVASVRTSISPVDGGPLKMRAFLSEGLDLFSHEGVCQRLRCRLGYAEQVARSIALMSDEVWLYDYFTERIQFFGRRENFKFETVLDDIYVLHAIKPLIDVGILKFRSPFRAVCSGCLAEFNNRVEALTSDLYKEFGKNFKILRNSGGGFSLDTGLMYDPPLKMGLYPKTDKVPSKIRIAKDLIYNSVRSSMWAARDAELVRGAVFSNSQVGLSGLLREEGRFSSSSDLQAIEINRAADIPWVSGLSMPQTLQLREEAHEALPRLRAFLASHLSQRKIASASGSDYISQLREQAAEVKAELNALRARRSTLMRGALGIASLSICVYGFASEPVAAIGQLLATLGLLHQVEAPEESHKAELKSRPGYVLVKAQEILQHADSGT